jgi:hypothetical protein
MAVEETAPAPKLTPEEEAAAKAKAAAPAKWRGPMQLQGDGVPVGNGNWCQQLATGYKARRQARRLVVPLPKKAKSSLAEEKNKPAW